jgi:hypothetical protein
VGKCKENLNVYIAHLEVEKENYLYIADMNM